MILISQKIKPSVVIGKFIVSTMSHRAEAGGYQASVTVSSGNGPSSHHRVFRLLRSYATPEAAQLVALTQGWLHTSSGSHLATC
jgi:hypothetical protein